ncbi:hypothetical protein [Novosphingobium mangrovi (ex Hu et al. 2023)]|uniref:DUF3311 domain-containing protein n=1 Tax=Novosphingobium mangrovi (ex Hu et al. 2023) TaxID=2930094 RepID=A0ABT0AB84_9SPHN|nr:hypothetical protein [Novosphingobium mangrovi (ex Hu et al. 2023)]MCJ1960442.1 hypothetical protein [Novosphingobium mangrovi (ex Hu et al. 2023)]
MSGIPPRRAAEMPDGAMPWWPPLLGIALPLALVLASALLVPASAGRFLGISWSSWCLFACAPLTSLCLLICYRFGGAASDRDDVPGHGTSSEGDSL